MRHGELDALGGRRSVQVAMLQDRDLVIERVLVTNAHRQTYLLRSPSGRAVAKFFDPDLDDQYPVMVHRDLLRHLDYHHDRLVTPRVLETGFDPQAGHWVFLEFLAGDDLKERWSYRNPLSVGGQALDESTVDHAIELLHDLRAVDSRPLVDIGLRVLHPRMGPVERAVRYLTAAGLLTATQAREVTALALAATRFRSDRGLMVSNGDFRPSNMIELDRNRTALVDWDAARASTSELENCLAYFWLFLFRRPDLRRRLIHQAHHGLDADKTALRAMTVLQSALLVHRCRVQSDPPRQLAEDLRSLLSGSLASR